MIARSGNEYPLKTLEHISPKQKIIFVSFVQQYVQNEFLLLTRYANLRGTESGINFPSNCC